jgi:Mrp family chromosome partitioning ATPase
MGEITEALRRARVGDKARPPAERGPRAARADVELPVGTPAGEAFEVSRERDGFWSPRALLVEEQGAAAEATRHLALRIKGELERLGARSFAVTSALFDEGKTTISGNLAFALASLSPRRTVAIVDLDLRKPSLERSLHLPVRAGIDDVLLGAAGLEDACIPATRPQLDVYPVRSRHDAAHELLVRGELGAAVRELERRYEIVVVDTPPVLLVPDTPIILRHVACCVVVARAGHTRANAFRRAIELLPRRKLIGCVLNEGQLPTDAQSYRYYSS